MYIRWNLDRNQLLTPHQIIACISVMYCGFKKSLFLSEANGRLEKMEEIHVTDAR